jgi:hypothetical protein
MPEIKDRIYQLGYMTDFLASEVVDIQNIIKLMNEKIDKCPGCPGPLPDFVNQVTQKVASVVTQVSEINQLIVANSVKSASIMS